MRGRDRNGNIAVYVLSFAKFTLIELLIVIAIIAPMRDYLSRADLQKKSFFLENVDLAI